MRLAENSQTLSRWANVAVPIYFSVFMFNITNPDEFMSGDRPIMQQLGPYVYLQKRKKLITHIDENIVCISLHDTKIRVVYYYNCYYHRTYYILSRFCYYLLVLSPSLLFCLHFYLQHTGAKIQCPMKVSKICTTLKAQSLKTPGRIYSELKSNSTCGNVIQSSSCQKAMDRGKKSTRDGRKF